MLVKPPIEKLLPKADNRYTLAILVAKRARQLVDGAMPLMECDSPNLVTLACEELASNRISCVHGLVEPTIPKRPDYENARQIGRAATGQNSAAEAIKEEFDQIGAMGFGEDQDEQDARVVADNLRRSIESETQDDIDLPAEPETEE